MSDNKELDDLKAQVKELKDQLNPPPRQPSTHPRYDPTEGMSMPRSAMKAMIDAVPDALMASLRDDARKPNPITGGPNPQPQPRQRATPNWIEERPLERPAGIEHVDRLVDAQDRLDKAERAYALWKAEALEKGK
jgi:hypothetical protein